MTDAPKKPETPKALVPFKEHVDSFKLLVKWLVALGSIPPILDYVFNVGPPWPGRSRVAWFTTIALWAVMVWTFGVWQGDTLARLKSKVNRFFWLVVISGAVFVSLTAFFVVDAPTPATQIAKGFFLKPEWQKVIDQGKFPDGEPIPAKSTRELLAANEWNAEVIYPEWTVSLVNLGLLAGWLAFFASLAALTSVFLLQQEKRAATKP
jgi:hypothetical protein